MIISEVIRKYGNTINTTINTFVDGKLKYLSTDNFIYVLEKLGISKEDNTITAINYLVFYLLLNKDKTGSAAYILVQKIVKLLRFFEADEAYNINK